MDRNSTRRTEQREDQSKETEYTGMRVDGRAVVLNLTERRRLDPDRSLDVVRHSPSGFEWGYGGSGPAQLACALLLDYYDDAAFAREHYQAFKNAVVSGLACDGPDDAWHLTGAEIKAALETDRGERVPIPDGGASPDLPSNWGAVSRVDQIVYQRRDYDQYIVVGDGRDEQTIVLCSQGDRAYPAPLAVRVVSEEESFAATVEALVRKGNDLIEPANRSRDDASRDTQ